MRKSEIERRVEAPYMKIIPEACNHIIVSSRSGNAIDIMCSMSVDDSFYVVTKNGNRVSIDADGTPKIEERLR